MNKTKKIAIAVVSLAMAGTMAVGVFGCNNNKTRTAAEITGDVVTVKADGSIDYNSYTRSKPVTLNMACGHNNLATSMSFKTLSNSITLPDGVAYENGDLKPAWQQISDDLNIGFNDYYLGNQTSDNLGALINATGDSAYSHIDVFTSDLSKVVERVSQGTSVLNLGDYLDHMPHFKAFLEDNPVVYLSLLQEGMNTTTGANKNLYVAPYFDGYDDIERYYLIRQDWAEKVLNGDTALDTAIPTGAKAPAAEAEFTANYDIESLNATGAAKQTITKDYTAAKTAVTTAGTALNNAYVAIAGASATFAGANGNIITIMNDAMTKGAANATADKLADLYRAYIDVAYKVGSNAAYTADKRANLFNGYDAAWDVDDLVAIMRILTRAPQALTGSNNAKIQGIVARENNNDRSPDVLRLVTGLYGARGADSRFEYGYIDANNEYQDARLDEDFYNAILKGNKLYQEGLITENYYTSGGGTYKGTVSAEGEAEGFMMYDYVQTQTGEKGFNTEIKDTPSAFDLKYKLGAIINPVAKWSVSAQDDTIMRFTESWRSTKTGGIALNGELKYNKDKLMAALQFVDYLYSEDGRIVSTFGPMATNANGDGGFWYNTAATTEQVTDGKFFTYKGVKYFGSDYKGEITPTITTDMYNSFLGKKTKEPASADKACSETDITTTTGKTAKARRSFTNYARMLIGSTLPMCVKNQSFEYQCTAQMGKTSAYIVGVAIDKGILKHLTPNIKVSGDTLKGVVKVEGVEQEVSSWYIMVPSGLPTDSADQQNILDATTQTNFKQCTGTKPSSVEKANYYSFFHQLMAKGFAENYNLTNVGTIDLTTNNTVAKLVTNLKVAQGGNSRETVLQTSWETAVDYAKYLFANN